MICGTKENRDKIAEEMPENEMCHTEQIIVEDYLDGKFRKWNSNSGWFGTCDVNASVQAFCHWTYHYTRGKLLFCDAQR